MDVQRLLAEEEEGWRGLLGAFADVPAERFEEPTLTPEGWSAKDAMFHVGYWLEDCARVLTSIGDGSFDADAEGALDIESINGEGFARSREVDVGTVRSALTAGRERARAAFGALNPVTREASEWFEESGPIHYRTHARDLDVWLRG